KAQFDAGREDERRALHNMLFRRAMEKGDTVAALFLLKTRHGYRDSGAELDTTKRLNITFNLPGALPLSALPVIEQHADADNRAIALSRTGLDDTGGA